MHTSFERDIERAWRLSRSAQEQEYAEAKGVAKKKAKGKKKPKEE